MLYFPVAYSVSLHLLPKWLLDIDSYRKPHRDSFFPNRTPCQGHLISLFLQGSVSVTTAEGGSSPHNVYSNVSVSWLCLCLFLCMLFFHAKNVFNATHLRFSFLLFERHFSEELILCKLSVSSVWEGHFELACMQQLVQKTEKTGCPHFKICIWQNDQP